MHSILFAIFLFRAEAQSDIAVRKALPAVWTNSGALALDGSEFIYYVSRGAEKNKYVIYQKGGGWCFSDLECAERSSTELGTSKSPLFTPSINFNSFSETSNFDLLHSNETQNPQAWNWTRIYLPYLDGGSQIGDLSEAVIVGNQTIYYRGARIHRATVATLLNDEGLASASDVLLSGGSAGALSTYLHADSWRDAILAKSPAARFVAVPDSGFFLNYNATTPHDKRIAYGEGMRWVFNRMNGTGGVPQDCVAQNREDPALCVFAEVLSKSIRAPLFAQQSTYDSYQVDAILQNSTPEAINAYGDVLASRVHADLLMNHADAAVFLDSCYHHVSEWGHITIDGQVVSQALQMFYNSVGKGGKRVWAQGKTYPCELCCKNGQ